MRSLNKRHTISALPGIGVAALLIWGFEDEPQQAYYRNEGNIFGTYYNIRYESSENMEDSIKAAFKVFDNSLNMFNPHSILSVINANRDTTTNDLFEQMWQEASRVYTLSDGAFDITVAPFVNYWGFGREGKQSKPRDRASIQKSIDSIGTFVGFDKIALIDHKVIKTDSRIQIDGGAIAKGQACDMVAELLRKHGCTNYLVDIGGEVVAHGVNQQGDPWRIGISKPNISNEGAQEGYEQIVSVRDISMATSGNYRNYYYDGDARRSHTIDPRTGWPVQHSVLSATVVSSSCMRSDALATSCMVLGAEKAMEMIQKAGDAACYLIVAEEDSLQVIKSSNWEEMMLAQ